MVPIPTSNAADYQGKGFGKKLTLSIRVLYAHVKAAATCIGTQSLYDGGKFAD
jgi:hypothetical protein